MDGYHHWWVLTLPLVSFSIIMIYKVVFPASELNIIALLFVNLEFNKMVLY